MLPIHPGTPADYAVLAPFHYRAGPPATFARVLTARDGPTLAAVLVVSMPALNASWRRAAWPGRFGGCKRAAARRLNAELRTISRVIVDPRYRGRGLARALVRAYLDSPLTPLTEAGAAMGRFCPFFTAAGMREVPTAPTPRDRALAARLRALRIDPVALLDLTYTQRLLARRPDLAQALRTWSRSHKAVRVRRAHPPPLPHIAALAAATLAAPTTGYANP